MDSLSIENPSTTFCGPTLDKVETLDISVSLLNFKKLKWKLTQSSESTWSESTCDLAEIEYRKFLSLKKWYPKQPLVPSKLIDKFWHEHILDTKSYMEDCEKVFGYYIHHYPYFGIYGEDDQKNLQEAFNDTIKLYETHFGKFPTDDHYGNSQATRCGDDHACHVPTSCACRVPGACK